MLSTGSERVFVVGIDSLPYDVVTSLAGEKLPTFAKILKEGCYGILESTIPPVSPVAWPSLVTGKNAGKHKVFGFSHVSGGITKPCYSTIAGSNPVWDVAGEGGKRVIVLNTPFTYPPYPVNGILISGFPSPLNRIKSFPPESIDRLRSEIGDYELDVSIKKENYEGMDETSFVDEISRITDIRAKATFHLMENYRWDFFMTVFTSLDRLQHVFYGYYDQDSPLYDSEKKRILCKYYEKLDTIIGDILSKTDKETYLFIVSDHGFDYLIKYVGVNNILSKHRFLKQQSRYLNREKFRKLWRSSLLVRKIVQALPGELVSAIQSIVPSEENCVGSVAYCDYPSTITLKKALTPKLKRRIKKEIIDCLYSVRDSETNKKIIDKVYAREEILSGNLGEGPDIFILFTRGYESKRWTEEPIQRSANPSSGRTTKTGAHSSSYARRGFLSVLGNSVKRGLFIESSILDITPTILHILDIPIPVDIDGRVLTEIFVESSEMAKRDIKYTMPSSKSQPKQYYRSEEEEASVRKRLKELGYFD